MGLTIIHHQVTTARKQYADDGWEFIDEWISGGCCVRRHCLDTRRITFSEGRILVSYRNGQKNGGVIEKGDRYVRQFNNYDGDVYTWRMKEELYNIACKYDLFPEL